MAVFTIDGLQTEFAVNDSNCPSKERYIVIIFAEKKIYLIIFW